MADLRSGGKSANAFRTISEVSEELHVPQHVLRFWESKFTQLKPLKRGGGRRYYRPEDISLLKRIQNLLYDEGYTIKGVQRLFKEGRVQARTRQSPKSREPVDSASMAAGDGAEGGLKARRRELAEVLKDLEAIRKTLRSSLDKP